MVKQYSKGHYMSSVKFSVYNYNFFRYTAHYIFCIEMILLYVV